ncbi:MAG: beta-propeller fold lactonase family protein [Microbacterium sp.]
MTGTESLVLVANAGDGSISTFRLAGDRLERLAVTGGLTGCSTFAVDAERDLVYAGVKGEPAGIVTLALDRATGVLTERSRLDLPAGGMNYLALTHGGSALLGASYGGGYGIVCPVEVSSAGAVGSVGEPTARVAYPNLHSVLPSPDGRFAYFVSLGGDFIAQYALSDALALTPLDPPTAAAPTGSGPRHLVIDDDHGAVYVLTEFSAEVLHYRRDSASGTRLRRVGARMRPGGRARPRRLRRAGIRSRITTSGAPICTSRATVSGRRSAPSRPSVRSRSRPTER